MITEKEIRTGAGPRWDRIRALLDERDPGTDDRTIDVSPPPTRDDPLLLTSCLPFPLASIISLLTPAR